MSIRLLAAALSIALLTACGGSSEPAAPDAPAAPAADAAAAAAPVAAPEDVEVFDLAIGDCLAEHAEGDVSESTKVDCATPHATQVFHLFDLPAGDLPVGDAMDEAVKQGCLAQFEAYVGLDFDSSEFTIQSLQPTAESWAAGDREVVCMLAAMDGSPITGDLKGAAR